MNLILLLFECRFTNFSKNNRKKWVISLVKLHMIAAPCYKSLRTCFNITMLHVAVMQIKQWPTKIVEEKLSFLEENCWIPSRSMVASAEFKIQTLPKGIPLRCLIYILWWSGLRWPPSTKRLSSDYISTAPNKVYVIYLIYLSHTIYCIWQ